MECLSLLTSGYLLENMGCRITTFLGLALTFVHYIILYFSSSFWIGLLAMGIFGYGIGIGYFPLLSIIWKYFPNKKGVLSGVTLACFGSGSFMWVAIADAMINPNNLSSDKDGYYSEEVFRNVKSFWKIMAYVVLGAIVLVTPISFDYYEDDIQVEDLTENEYDEINEETKTDKKEEEKKKPSTKLLLKIFFSWEYTSLCLMQNGTAIFNYLVSTTMRPFGEINQLPVRGLKILSLVNSIINGVGRIIWGQIIDLVGTRICLFVEITIFIVCSGTYFFCGFNIVLYFIVNIVTQIGTSGSSVLLSLVNKEKSGEYFLILWGYAGLYYGLSCWVGPFCVKVLDIKTRGISVYLFTYLICCGFCVLSFILACAMGDKPIDYNKYKSKEELEEEKCVNDNNELEGNLN
jgi:OFA family oxalate/formate antiporter-like MFS transporter